MTKKTFHDWFTMFVETVETRPRLLLFDCHLTHLSFGTIDLAIHVNISLVKLAAHCTDVLQPLDVSCFSPLKEQYEKLLTEFVHRTGGGRHSQNQLFVTLLQNFGGKDSLKKTVFLDFRKLVYFQLIKVNIYKVDR